MEIEGTFDKENCEKKDLNKTANNPWVKFTLKAGKLAWLIFSGGTIIIAYFAFIPRLALEPGVSLNPKLPFETRFILQNQSFFSMKQVSYYNQWIEGKRNPQLPKEMFCGLCYSTLDTLKPEAKYSLRIIAENQGGIPPQVPISKCAILTVVINYDYLYFFKHEEKAFEFFTKEDREGNYQCFQSEGDVPVHGMWNANSDWPTLAD